MNKLFLASLLILGAGVAQAETPHLVNADGSALSAVCIAAVTSREAMYATATELGVRDLDAAELRCNGMALSRFVSALRVKTEVNPAGYVFSKSDDTPVTELCLAAVRSEQEYENVKERYFGDDANIEAEVQCNGMPLQSFTRRYRAPAPTISLR